MATLLELKGLFTDSDLQDKAQAALIISVQNVLEGTPTADDHKFAAHVFTNPRSEAMKTLMSILAANSGITVAQIQGASDTAIQNNVDAVISSLSAAYNAV